MKILSLFILTFLFVSCGNKANTTDGAVVTETAQQVGDVMASVDEVGGSSGAIASYEKSIRRDFEKYAPNELNENYFANLFLPNAQAVTCNAFGFAACSGKTITRTFGGCTVGTATFAGTVTVTWAGTGTTTCGVNSLGNTISRIPAFTIEGRRGATLTVSKSATTGQVMTWASGSGTSKVFNYTNDGIQRKFVDTLGATVYDHITTVTSPIAVTGTLRSGRVMNGGTIRVLNNVSNATCDFSPVNVTWASPSCNCPTQGTWQGTCTDGTTTKSNSLVLTGCGTASYTEGDSTDTVTFDRCGA